ncbi:MAG: signal recognition particle-docking protein FtsY, partial [Acidimicrobiales bacterium]
PILLVLVVAVLLVGVTAGLVVASRRRTGPVLEPPPDRTTLERRSAVEAPPDRSPPSVAPDADVIIGTLPASAPVGPALVEPELVGPEVVAPRRPSFRDRLTKARGTFSGYVGTILSRPGIDQESWDDLEEALLRADVGPGPTQVLLDSVRDRVKVEGLTTGPQLVEAVKADMKQRLAVADRGLRHDEGTTNVWLFVGVNGVGKTTTIGKVAKGEAEVGRTIVMAAGDTFRAAAAEQLTTWAERAGSDIVRGAEGADPSSIIYDAIEKAAARGADLVLADTAGRLHTKTNLMEELRKVKRVASKPPGNLTETLLVLDATTGQNGLVQARQFTEAVDITGVVLTKLDGSAKGGIVFAIQSELGIPVKLVGLGESADDLVAFEPDEFVDALFSE